MKLGDRRKFYRDGLNPLYLQNYDKLCELMPPEWQPYSGFRTFQEQAQLYAKGRSARQLTDITPGLRVTNAMPGQSPHNFGCASDWTIFDDKEKPVWLAKDDPKFYEYRDACREAGSRWGGDFKTFPDMYHNELWINCSWADILEVYRDGGYPQVEAELLKRKYGDRLDLPK